jgi:hypothetical protein
MTWRNNKMLKVVSTPQRPQDGRPVHHTAIDEDDVSDDIEQGGDWKMSTTAISWFLQSVEGVTRVSSHWCTGSVVCRTITICPFSKTDRGGP